MEPSTCGHMMDYCKEQLTPPHKLRKPLVEKQRRDRINVSVERLKALLRPELLRHRPDSRQEKADVLEMAVAYLRHRRHQQPPGFAAPSPADSGYSRCVQEAIGFLSRREATKTPSHARLLAHFHGLRGDAGGHDSPCRPAPSPPPGSPLHGAKGPAGGLLWRPW